MKKVLLVIFLSIWLYGSEKCIHDSKAVKIARNSNIDLRTKSVKGWIRLLKNKEKYAVYVISDSDRKFLIKCLTEQYKNKPKIGRML